MKITAVKKIESVTLELSLEEAKELYQIIGRATGTGFTVQAYNAFRKELGL